MNLRADGEFRLPSCAPPPGRTVPRHGAARASAGGMRRQKRVSLLSWFIPSPTTRLLHDAERTRLLDAARTTATARHRLRSGRTAEGRTYLRNRRNGAAIPMQPDLPARSRTPLGRAARNKARSQVRIQGVIARVRKEDQKKVHRYRSLVEDGTSAICG
jgi:hypothetical protein